jgi:hypothetical protein
MRRASGFGISNLARLAMWQKDILTGGLEDLMKMSFVLGRL